MIHIEIISEVFYILFFFHTKSLKSGVCFILVTHLNEPRFEGPLATVATAYCIGHCSSRIFYPMRNTER